MCFIVRLCNLWQVTQGAIGNARIGLIHDTHHLCTRFRIDGIKALSSGISGGKQKIKFANLRNRGRLCSFCQNENDDFFVKIVIQNLRLFLEFRQN